MAEYPYLNFYPSDYIGDGDVQLCTTAQEGIYIRLLSFAWLEGSLPCDVDQVLLICKRDARRQDVKHVMDTFFTPSGERLINIRLEVERQLAAARTDKAALAGRASGKKRELKRQLKLNASSNLVDENTAKNPTQSQPSKAKAILPPNPHAGGIDLFNEHRRKRLRYPPITDRSPDGMRAWIRMVPESLIPRDATTVSKILAVAASTPDEFECATKIEKIAKGQTL